MNQVWDESTTYISINVHAFHVHVTTDLDQLNFRVDMFNMSLYPIAFYVSLTVSVSQANLCGRCRSYERCCEVSGYDICTIRDPCYGVCQSDVDCPDQTERCETEGHFCTSFCSSSVDCRSGYECIYSQCEEKESNNSSACRKIVITTVTVVAAVSFLCCCYHLKKQRGRNDQGRNTAQAGNQPPVIQGSGETRINLACQQNASSNTDQIVRTISTDETPDPIRDSGPPAYHSLSFDNFDIPEAPPPSYDEAVATISRNDDSIVYV